MTGDGGCGGGVSGLHLPRDNGSIVDNTSAQT